MRDAFIKGLTGLAAQNPRIALVVGDVGFSVVEPFANAFPDRYFNAGIAEQAMMGMAAGLASEGFHVFVYSIANFPTFRCAEQIRNDIAHHRLPVTVVAVGGGVMYGNLGYTHHGLQDYALLRSLPGMRIGAPGSAAETDACLRYFISHPGPSYLRLGRLHEATAPVEIDNLTPGQWVFVSGKPDASVTILCTGATQSLARRWMKTSQKECALYSIPLWGAGAKELQPKQLQSKQNVITLEDHLYDAGFGSWLLEALGTSPELRQRVCIRALGAEIEGQVGAEADLWSLGHLDEMPDLLRI